MAESFAQDRAQVEVTATITDALAFSGPFSEYGSGQRLGTRSRRIYADSSLLQNPEMQWRHTARARRSMELLRG